MIPADWTPHRRPGDREPIGWIRPEGDDWIAVDLLGREVTAAVDWLDAEAALEEIGLSPLAGIWMLEREGEAPLRVRLVEVTPDQIVVQTDDFGAIDAPVRQFVLPWPAPERLRERRTDDPDGRELFGGVIR